MKTCEHGGVAFEPLGRSLGGFESCGSAVRRFCTWSDPHGARDGSLGGQIHRRTLWAWVGLAEATPDQPAGALSSAPLTPLMQINSCDAAVWAPWHWKQLGSHLDLWGPTLVASESPRWWASCFACPTKTSHEALIFPSWPLAAKILSHLW